MPSLPRATTDEQPLIQQDDIQLHPLSAAYHRRSYDRVPSYPYEGHSHFHESHDDSPDIADVRTTIANEIPPKNAPTARIRRESQFSSSEAPRGDKRRRQQFFSTWWLETSACIISVAALLALTAILWQYKNKPSPDWPNWLSLNTIVAIFATIVKTSILLVVAQGLGQLKWSWLAEGSAKPLQDLVKYDDASRGPIGSLRLLWRLRLSNVLSSLAALITVLAVVTDPFAQQILRYYDCSMPVPGISASLPRTNLLYEAAGLHTDAGLESISPGVQSAVNAGISYPELDPSVNCATGNCTWPTEYSTVGWCSYCEDISYQITITDMRNSTTGFRNVTTSLPGSVSTSSDLYLKPGSQQMAAAAPFNTSFGLDFLLGASQFNTSNPATGNPWPDCNTTDAKETLWKCRGYGAARCSMKPCVKTFNASIEAGKLTETLLSTSTSTGWGYPSEGGFMQYMIDTECINTVERTMLLEGGYKIDPQQRWLGYNVTFNIWNLTSNTFPESMAFRSCMYGIDGIFVESLAYWFGPAFSGDVVGPWNAPEEPLGTFEGLQALQTIYNYGNVSFESVTQTFENISISLTNWMRQNGVANYSVPAVGIATQDRTCVAIRWAWLTYPAALVALTLCFFVLMVLQTWPSPTARGQNSPGIFKSNPLPLLYHGLWHREWTVHDRYDNTTDTADLKAMKELATETKVKFNSTLDGNVARLEVQDEHDI